MHDPSLYVGWRIKTSQNPLELSWIIVIQLYANILVMFIDWPTPISSSSGDESPALASDGRQRVHKHTELKSLRSNVTASSEKAQLQNGQPLMTS